jgi:hypothetical protein
MMATATTIQFWNVTPTSAKCSAGLAHSLGLPTLKAMKKLS